LRAALGCNIDISHVANFRYEIVTQKVRKRSLLSLKKFHKGNHIDHALLIRITKPTNDRNPTRRRIKNVESLITPKGTKILLLYIFKEIIICNLGKTRAKKIKKPIKLKKPEKIID